MDWYELNERFREFDELCESLCKEFKINLYSDCHQSTGLRIDLSSHQQQNNLLSYALLMPNRLKPITYNNLTNQLLDELANDCWFKSRGTLLRTLEKGVFNPVLHYSIINDKDKKSEHNFIELFKSEFGQNYTLYQAIYEELYALELPVITKKVPKNSSISLTIKPVKSEQLKYSIHNYENEDKSTSFDYLSADYSSTDSGCASLNSTTNDYVSLDDVKNTVKNCSTESLNSSNDSVLNSNDQITLRKNKINHADVMKNRTLTDQLIANNQLNYNLYNNVNGSLNDGHLIVGFRIKDKFFRKVFEAQWQEITGARLLSLSAAKFGLRTLRFMKRIALNTQRQGREHDDGTTFTYILHAKFENLTNKNDIYFSNFVHRLRLRTLGSITLYTNIMANN